MGWQDRDYNRDARGGGSMRFLTGSVPLFTAFGIEVRAHASLVIAIILGLLFGFGLGFGFHDRIESVVALFLIVLLHEFGHCFAARWVGGTADQIIMHPLGGLALSQPPHRPLPTFITVAGGPFVNVLICIACGAILLSLTGGLPPNPFVYYPIHGEFERPIPPLVTYSYWIYQMSYSLLVFNLLPIFPLDGGQMLQAVLWARIGFFRSMKLSTEIGMVAAGCAAAFALSTHAFGLAILAGLGFYTCYMMRMQLLADSPGDFEALSYAVGPEPVKSRRRKESWIKSWRDKRAQAAEVSETMAVDQILEKVAKSGMHSLTGGEKRTLKRASENQKKRDAMRGRR